MSLQNSSARSAVFSSEMEVPVIGDSPLGLTRQDTSSSTGSAKPIPKGNWTLNLSGNCPGCHHHHTSVKVQVKATSEFNHVGDVYCEHCRRLWLGFGKRNSTRISLMSTETIEVPEQETIFRSTLVQMIRSATNIAALSPILADIPEAASSGPSRELSVRSAPHNGTDGTVPNTDDSAIPQSADIIEDDAQVQGGTTASRVTTPRNTMIVGPRASRRSRVVLRIRQRIGATFPALRNSPLSRWFPNKTSKSIKGFGEQAIGTSASGGSLPMPPIAVVNEVGSRIQADMVVDPMPEPPNVCASPTTNADALQTVMSTDVRAVQTLSPDQRVAWMRKRITAFKSQSAEDHAPNESPEMVDSTTQVDLPDILPVFPISPSRRHSALAFVGNRFGSFAYWEVFRGSTSTLNGRPLSMSETHLSEADTVVEGRSISSVPRHIFRESLQPTHRGSGSPRPLSVQSVPQDWQQVHDYRAESRWSFDSAGTGRAVRSIPAPRHAMNRSRSSLARGQNINFAESTMSQPQLSQAPDEGLEYASIHQRRSSPSPSPPN